MVKQPGLRHFCDLHVELGPLRSMGNGRGGERRIIPIIGGTVRGPDIEGTILNLGADWQCVHRDGLAFLDTRYAFETNDGGLIEIVNRGFRHGPQDVMDRLANGEDCDPDSYYMRTHATLETGHPAYKWVNSMIFIGSGARRQSSVEMALFVVE